MCNRTMNSECNIVGFFPHNGTDCSVVRNYLIKGGNIQINTDGRSRGEQNMSATGWVITGVGVDTSEGYRETLAWGGTYYGEAMSSFKIEALAVDEVTSILLQLIQA